MRDIIRKIMKLNKIMNDFEKHIAKKSLIEMAEEIEKMMLAGKKNEREKKLYYDLFKSYFEENGAVEYAEWQKKLKEMGSDTIVRRENPKEVLNVLENGQPLHIDNSADYGKYPNAAILGNDLTGLKIALAGGFEKIGEGSVAITVGFKPSGNLIIEDLPNGEFTNFKGNERRLTKIAEGDIPLEDIKFFLLRMPHDFFPEEEMTDFELEKSPAHIQRMYVLKNQENEKGPVSFN